MNSATDTELTNTSDKFGYIYKITNLIDGRIYIGKRQSSTFDPYYWGSGTHITRAIKKYGKENFNREIIEWCYSLEEIVSREMYWIAELDAQNPNIGYNLSKGGLGSAGCKWSEESKDKLRQYKGPKSPNWGRCLTEEHRKHLSEAHTGKTLSDEHKEKISIANTGKVRSSETREKISNALTGVSKNVGEDNPFYGKHWTEEQKVANGAAIKAALSDPEVRKRMSDSHKGKQLPREQVEKIRQANTGKKRTPEQCQKMSEIRRGVPKPEKEQRRLRTLSVGRIWIHNKEGKTKMIYPEEFNLYLEQGWLKGRKD